MRRAAPAAALLLAALALVLAVVSPALAATPRTSLPDVEDEVMCVSCRVALNVAESPQADRERALIRTLVAQGLTKQQIKDRLVDEYGEGVLAMPEDHGVGLAALLVPIAVVAALLGLVALLLPRWRRRARAGAPVAPATAGPAVTDAELRRVDEDLRRLG
jgi:cytochrome c-type biogenesis protein CcmH/NrfF